MSLTGIVYVLQGISEKCCQKDWIRMGTRLSILSLYRLADHVVWTHAVTYSMLRPTLCSFVVGLGMFREDNGTKKDGMKANMDGPFTLPKQVFVVLHLGPTPPGRVLTFVPHL